MRIDSASDMHQDLLTRLSLSLPSEGASKGGHDGRPARSELRFFDMANETKKMHELAERDRFPLLVKRFEETLLDAIRAEAKENGGKWTPSAPALKHVAINAFDEAMTSDFDDAGKEVVHPPRLLANVWNAVIKINESAYRQGLIRMEKAKTLGFELITVEKAAAGDYV